jgi:hypothetical protein
MPSAEELSAEERTNALFAEDANATSAPPKAALSCVGTVLHD